MELVLSIVVGVLFASGCYLLMQRTLGHVIIGLALLTNATNLLIFVAAGPRRDRAALIPEGGLPEGVTTVDPLPQALILTAIVIGFGVLAFFIALAYRAYRSVGSDDLAHMNTTDRVDGGTAHSRADALRPALEMLGAELLVDCVDMRPGHPVLLAQLPRRDGALSLLGLPGNPLAGFCALTALGVPLLEALRGIDAEARTRTSQRTAGAQLSGARRGVRLLPVRRGPAGVLPAGHSRSHMMRGLAVADELAIVPEAGLAPGDPVECLPVPGQRQGGLGWDG